MYAQWFHTYETDTASIELVLATYRRAFDRVAVWYGRGIDLVLLGFQDADARRDLDFVEARFERTDLRRLLADLGIDSLAALLAHEVLPVGVVGQATLPDRDRMTLRFLIVDPWG